MASKSSWSVCFASLPSDNDDYSIHDIDGSDSDDDKNQSMSRNNSHQSITSEDGGQYVQISLVPSNAPERLSRSRSNSTNDGRTTPEVYTDGSYTSREEEQSPYTRCDSQSSIQLRGNHDSAQFSGVIKRNSQLRYMRRRHSLSDSVKNVINVQRLAKMASEGVDEGELEPDEETVDLWREVAEDLNAGEFVMLVV
jgi:hypothetical protein